ncbi:MAG TPA: RNA polymerase sporulation sigma factor SigK [Bacillota bacterium]|nr:RNA polymerase sporulation sigma factor SigK [Clostridia bacterium]HNR03482.1 RNA polymerase sporulation sigma factor SigK [Bacillota bacterium]HRU41528.1 RNA polymerase sporulation sigma factor SigK [Candidatus Diapherotrites archaeon]HNT02658.1 RNA polymerase sporulation sigma factor SigK [Bacillota bacterium]HNU80669.1 RNA polymerase sporulation sigma factor SigK [Bacillota bacterium]
MLLFLASLIVFTIKDLCLLFGYIQNVNSFPQPLTTEEEQYYLEEYKRGNEDAKNILVERNLRLVAHIVKKYVNTGREIDDLISIGTIGLIKAIITFDESKGTRLATYAARCIENEILMTIRASKKTKTEVSLHDPIGIDKEGNEISLIDILGSDSDIILDEVELKIQIKKLYQRMDTALKKRERLVIELRYGLLNGISKTQREIADMLGISRSYVSRIENRAIKKLHKELYNENG